MKKKIIIFVSIMLFLFGCGFDYDKTTNINKDESFNLYFENPLTISVIGDSITYGAMPDGTKGIAYPERLAKLVNAKTINNYGISGTTIAVNSPLSMVSRFQDIDKNSNVIIIGGGTNDFGMSTPLGTIDSIDTSTFNGALNYMLSNLKVMFPNKYIIIDTPLPRADQFDKNKQGLVLADYTNALKEAAKRHNVYLVDLNSCKNLNFVSDLNKYMMDGLHPNDIGQQMIAEKLKVVLFG